MSVQGGFRCLVGAYSSHSIHARGVCVCVCDNSSHYIHQAKEVAHKAHKVVQ
jgi:hypothetical protein